LQVLAHAIIFFNRRNFSTRYLYQIIAFLSLKIVAMSPENMIFTIRPLNHTLFIGKIVDAKPFNNELPLSTIDYEGVYLGKN